MRPDDIIERWRQAFGTEPPAARREFLVANLACHEQAQQQGGLPAKIAKQLESIALGQPAKTRPSIRPGTKLIRMWQGEPHEVLAQDGGTYLYHDTTYRSLSAIANHITGTRWNGKVFFRLQKTSLYH